MRLRSKFSLDHPPAWDRAVVVALAAVLLACGLEAQNGQGESGSKKLATVDGKPVTEAEVLAEAAPQLDGVEAQRLQCELQADQSRHQVIEQTVRQLVRDRLVEDAATKAGLDSEAWLKQEMDRRQEAISEETVTDFYERNKARMRNATRDQIAPQIRQYLATEELYADLEKSREIAYMLDPYRIEVEATGPSKGTASAPVTVVEFSDFQCPYCKRVVPMLQQALEKYEGKIQLVFRQYPLSSIHPQAYKAAEASLCAADQGKFWELHDAMFEDQSAAALDVTGLKAKAKTLGLDEAAFASCLDSGKHEEQVRKDLKDGTAAGVNGTPAFFVNGRPLSGAIGLDRLSEVVDEELADLEGGS